MHTEIEYITTPTGEVLCYIIPRSLAPVHTTFITPDDAKQQVGFIVYPAGGTIARHKHKAIERRLVGMSEVLVVRTGLCEIDIYDTEQHLVASRKLATGDVIILVGGGHGFRILEDTVFLEIKQGPYLGAKDKEKF